MAEEIKKFVLPGPTAAQLLPQFEGLDPAVQEDHRENIGAASEAEVADGVAEAKDRANHTGTQPMSTISDAGTAATLDVEDMPISTATQIALNGKAESTKVSVRVVYTSSTCTSNAELTLGVAASGTDQTAQLQAILDQASSGPLLVIVDGKYQTSRLRVRGNTHIKGLPGCGFILKQNTNAPLIENYNRTFAVGQVAVGVDENITLENLILNFNGNQQSEASNVTEGWVVGLRFVGVNRLTVRGCQLRDTRTFSSQVANSKNLMFDDNHIDTNVLSAIQNQDGLHFHGPISNAIVKNTSGYSTDDIVSFCANDIGVRGPDQPQNMLGALGQPYGDITDVVIDGLDLQNSNYGIRLLSSTSLMDRISIRNVSGYTRYHHWLIIGANIPAYGNPTGLGNFGTIMVTDCDALVYSALADEYIRLDGRIDTLIFRNIKRASGLASLIPTFRIDANARITNLHLEGYNYTHTNEIYFAAGPAPIHILNQGSIGKLDIINASMHRNHSGAADGILIQNNGTISLLNRSGLVAPNFATVIAGNSPTLTNTSSPDYIPTIASTWTGGTIYSVGANGGWFDSIYDPTALTWYSPWVNISHIWKTGTDAHGGNVRVSARLQMPNVLAGGIGTVGIFARASGTTETVLNTGYTIELFAPDANTVAFGLTHSGFSGNYLGTRQIVATPSNIPYDVSLNCNGTTISARAQRSTDNYYLTNTGTWSPTMQNFASVTNAIHAAVAGQVGVLNWQPNAQIGNKRDIRDFTVSVAD